MPEGGFELRYCDSFQVFGPHEWLSSLAMLVDEICKRSALERAAASELVSLREACALRNRGLHEQAKIWAHIEGDRRARLAHLLAIKPYPLRFPMASVGRPTIGGNSLTVLPNGDYEVVWQGKRISVFAPDGLLKAMKSRDGQQHLTVRRDKGEIRIDYFRGSESRAYFWVSLKLNAAGRISEANPRWGSTVALRYDSTGRLEQVIDSQRDWRFSYDADGYLKTAEGSSLEARTGDEAKADESLTQYKRTRFSLERLPDGRGVRKRDVSASGEVQACKEWHLENDVDPLTVRMRVRSRCDSGQYVDYDYKHALDEQGLIPRRIKEIRNNGQSWRLYDLMGRHRESHQPSESWVYEYDAQSRPIKQLNRKDDATTIMEVEWDSCDALQKLIKNGETVFEITRAPPPDCRRQDMVIRGVEFKWAYLDKTRSIDASMRRDGVTWTVAVDLDPYSSAWKEGRVLKDGIPFGTFKAYRDLIGSTDKREIVANSGTAVDGERIGSIISEIKRETTSPSDERIGQDFLGALRHPSYMDKAWVSRALR
jgi:YD repeat-containing protein